MSFDICWMQEHHLLREADLKRLTDQVRETSRTVKTTSEYVARLLRTATGHEKKASNLGKRQWTGTSIANAACDSVEGAKVLCIHFDFRAASNVKRPLPFHRHEWEKEKQHLTENPAVFWGGNIGALLSVSPPSGDTFLVVAGIKQNLDVKSATVYWNKTERGKRFVEWALQCNPTTLKKGELKCVARLARLVLEDPPRDARDCAQAFQNKYGKCHVCTMIAVCKASVNLAIAVTASFTYVSWLTGDGRNFASATSATIRATLMERHTAVEDYTHFRHEQITAFLKK